MPSERYLFDHIPKTGGMSMKAIFDELLGPENVSPVIRAGNASQVMAQMESKILITGHFWHSPGTLANRRRAYLTMLRQPEDRTVSVYYFFKHNVDSLDDRAVQLARSLELDEFLMSRDPTVLDNLQDFLVHHFRQLSLDGYSAATEPRQMLASAKEILDQYDFVGLQEAFTDSVDMMCYRFGWPAVATIPLINKTSERKRLDDLGPGIRSRLRDLNALDLELYEYAVRLFAERKRAMMRRFIDLKTEGEDAAGETRDVQGAPAAPSSTVRGAEFGDRQVEILGVEVRGAISRSPVVESGEDVVIAITALARGASDDFTVGIAVRDASHQMVFGTNSHHLGERWSVRPGVVYETEFRMGMILGDGLYFVTVALHEGPAHFQHSFHWREDAAPFEVRGRRGRYFQGPVDLSPTVARRESHPLSVFSAALSAEAAPGRTTAGGTLSVPVRIKNTGDQTWPASGPRPVHLSYHWLDASGNILAYNGLRTPFPRDMKGGDETTVQVTVEAPADPGAYVLRITLVQENVAWFDDRGLKPLDLPISIP